MNRNGLAGLFRTVQDDVDRSSLVTQADDENTYDWIRRLYRDSRVPPRSVKLGNHHKIPENGLVGPEATYVVYFRIAASPALV
jgi:hypothetical protein